MTGTMHNCSSSTANFVTRNTLNNSPGDNSASSTDDDDAAELRRRGTFCKRKKARREIFLAKVEHPFRALKQQSGYTRVRYRSLAKNTRRC